MWIVTFLLLACSGAPSGEDGSSGSDGSSSAGDGGSGVDGGATAASPPCATGDWGVLEDPDLAIHVAQDGSSTATGSASDPVDDPVVALTLARAAGLHAIFIGPGSFESNLSLDTRDDGMQLLGCPGESTLTGTSKARGVPLIEVSDATGVLVSSLALSGGRRAVTVWQGATVEIESVSISGSSRVGILVDGALTELSLVDVTIDSLETATDGAVDLAYGIVVQDGSLTMSGGSVDGATGVGLLGDSADITLTDVDITNTSPLSDDTLGRGIHVQSLSNLSVTGGTVDHNADAGIFALRAAVVALDGVTISNTAAALTADGESTGDGVVVTAGDTAADPGSYLASFTDCTITGSARAAILAEGEGVEVTGFSGNTFEDNGFAPDDSGLVVQESAIAPSTSGFYDMDGQGVAPLGTNTEGLATEEL